MKKEMSLIKSKCIQYIGNGIGWFAFGIFSMYDSTVFIVLSIVSLVICCASSFSVLMTTHEEEDEMSEYNMIKAKAKTMDWLKTISLGALLFVTLIGALNKAVDNINVNLGAVIPFIFGAMEIMIGIFFVKYEKDGE